MSLIILTYQTAIDTLFAWSGFWTSFWQITAIYYAGGAFFHYVAPAIFPVKSIQPRPPKKGDIVRDVVYSIVPIAVKAFYWRIIEELYERKIGLVYEGSLFKSFRLEVAYALATIFILDFLHDGWFYWTHRLLHWSPLYHHVHRHHHLSRAPTAFTGYSFHLIEAVIVFLDEITICFLMPVNRGLHRVYHLLTTLVHQAGHAGYEIYPFDPTIEGLISLLLSVRIQIERIPKILGSDSESTKPTGCSAEKLDVTANGGRIFSTNAGSVGSDGSDAIVCNANDITVGAIVKDALDPNNYKTGKCDGGVEEDKDVVDGGDELFAENTEGLRRRKPVACVAAAAADHDKADDAVSLSTPDLFRPSSGAGSIAASEGDREDSGDHNKGCCGGSGPVKGSTPLSRPATVPLSSPASSSSPSDSPRSLVLKPAFLSEALRVSFWLTPAYMMNTVQHHDLHHRFPTRHFSLYFTHWDRWCGTMLKGYDETLFSYFSGPKTPPPTTTPMKEPRYEEGDPNQRASEAAYSQTP